MKISSEAGFRFSRGVHPSQALLGARRAAELMRLYAGGTVSAGIIDYYPNPPVAEPIVLTATEVARIGGILVSQSEVRGYLEALQFEVKEQGDALLVTAPDHRLDIESSADLIEEVCRMYGYDRIPMTEMADMLPPQRTNVELEREERIKDILVGLSLQEVITYRLTTPEKEAKLLPAGHSRPDDRPYVTLANPITVERVNMRHSLLASVLEVAAANSRFQERVALFELGPVYLASEEGLLPDELRRLVIVMAGQRQRAFWADLEPKAMDFFDLKGIIEQLCAALHLDDLTFETGEHPTYRPGRTAKVFLADQQLGWMGELHPLVIQALDVRGEAPVIAADLDLEVLLATMDETFAVDPVSVFPAVHEDIALIVDSNVSAVEVTTIIESAGGPLLKEASLFDVYEGKPIPSGQKSLAYHLTFQAPDKTLTDRVVRKNRQRIVQQLQHRIGSRLRDA
jgi:phenylalanyl-tRNA synthetase beta chain